MPRATNFQRRPNQSVDNPVTVDFTLGRKASVKAVGNKTRAQNPNGLREHAVEIVEPTFSGELCSGHVNMRALPERVHAGVRPPGSADCQASSADAFESCFQVILDGVSVFLTLPAGEIASIVTDD